MTPIPDIDVVMLVALKDEYDQVISVSRGATDKAWSDGPKFQRCPTAIRRFAHSSGTHITVLTTWCTEMAGAVSAATAATLVERFSPVALAMSGVCAGRRGKTQQGDVIFADRVWTWDAGKLVKERTQAGNEVERYQGDEHQYRLPAAWKRYLQTVEGPQVPWWGSPARPEFLERQEFWVMGVLRDSLSPIAHPDRANACPDWEATLTKLRKTRLLKKGALGLTRAGERKIDRWRELNPDGLAPPPPFRVHLAPLATGSPVVEDPGIFGRLSVSMRKVKGLEMEAAAIGAVAEQAEIPFVVAKGVQDHADHDKDDRFRAFAARASAEFVLDFLRNAPELQLSTRNKVAEAGSGGERPSRVARRAQVGGEAFDSMSNSDTGHAPLLSVDPSCAKATPTDTLYRDQLERILTLSRQSADQDLVGVYLPPRSGLTRFLDAFEQRYKKDRDHKFIRISLADDPTPNRIAEAIVCECDGSVRKQGRARREATRVLRSLRQRRAHITIVVDGVVHLDEPDKLTKHMKQLLPYFKELSDRALVVLCGRLSLDAYVCLLKTSVSAMPPRDLLFREGVVLQAWERWLLERTAALKDGERFTTLLRDEHLLLPAAVDRASTVHEGGEPDAALELARDEVAVAGREMFLSVPSTYRTLLARADDGLDQSRDPVKHLLDASALVVRGGVAVPILQAWGPVWRKFA